MGKLFGTDGVRGYANQYPITPELAVCIGRAVASLLCNENKSEKHEIIIGKDTRISGTMLEYALASGICSMGVDVCLTGVLPTPGIAQITSSSNADAGIVISASHNPFFDNGIKVFNAKGFKLSDTIEKKIEDLVLDQKNALLSKDIQYTGNVQILENAVQKYIDFLKNALPKDFSLSGMKMVVDCANGATFQAGARIFSELGAEVVVLFAEPDGININQECGSQHPEALAQKVVEENAVVGLSFDGDGDRLIAVDEKGNIASGDQILAACAISMKKQGILKNNLLVTTIMSNIGLGLALRNAGIKHLMANVGDKYVMEEMIAHNAVIGGEDSGHIIFLDHHTTGDGILAALRLLAAMIQEKKHLSELLSVMTVFPQKLINVDVKHKPEIDSIPEIVEVIRSVEAELGSKGRVLVRYSGTQPMCRVMVEGPTKNITQKYCQKIVDVVKMTLG